MKLSLWLKICPTEGYKPETLLSENIPPQEPFLTKSLITRPY